MGANDPLFDQARDYVRATGLVSIPKLQRHFHIGYCRSLDIVNQLAAAGIVSGPNLQGLRTVINPEPTPCPSCATLRAEVERLRGEVLKWQRIRTPAHGSCCTCQKCGEHYDDCRCDLDEVADELTQARAEIAALRAALKPFADFYEGKPNKTIAAVDHNHEVFRAAHAALHTEATHGDH
ncbi:MAG TPA: DNA translocase FtsK [Dissulfurispiraceae bacterium]|nr:DNA translocase FtsK [Dissulfurispiraceae bacterium]